MESSSDPLAIIRDDSRWVFLGERKEKADGTTGPGIAVFRPVCIRAGQRKRRSGVEKEQEETRERNREKERERERERENDRLECLLGTYRAVTECKGWEEGSAVTPSEKIECRRAAEGER